MITQLVAESIGPDESNIIDLIGLGICPDCEAKFIKAILKKNNEGKENGLVASSHNTRGEYSPFPMVD